MSRPITIGELEKSKHIFVAEVNDIQVIEYGNKELFNQGLERGTLNALASYKGSPNEVTHIEAAHTPICCICSTKLSNEKYLVFANEAGILPISSCSNTGRLQYMPYHEEVLENLKSDSPTVRFTGIYDTRYNQLLIEDELRTAGVIEFTDHIESRKAYIDMEAYPLEDGSLFYVKTHSLIPLSLD